MVGRCEWAGEGVLVAVVKEVASCDAVLGSWLWQRSCSSWDVEAQPSVFGNLRVHLLRQRHGSTASC